MENPVASFIGIFSVGIILNNQLTEKPYQANTNKIILMKKTLLLIMLMITVSVASFAQQKVTKDETKVKKTSTVPQKVHNLFSKHKHYSGTKVKHVKKVEKAH